MAFGIKEKKENLTLSLFRPEGPAPSLFMTAQLAGQLPSCRPSTQSAQASRPIREATTTPASSFSPS